jgi:hypothetical protein
MICQGDAVYKKFTAQGKSVETENGDAAMLEKSALQEEAESLAKRLAETRQKNSEEEGRIRKAKFKLEADVAKWIEKCVIVCNQITGNQCCCCS